MIILHKTSRQKALKILKAGFDKEAPLPQDRVAKFLGSQAMIDRNQTDYDDCHMFFSWNGEIIKTDPNFNVENMEPEILYECGSWRCAIAGSMNENLRFLGATLSPLSKKDVEILRQLSDSIGQSVDVHP